MITVASPRSPRISPSSACPKPARPSQPSVLPCVSIPFRGFQSRVRARSFFRRFCAKKDSADELFEGFSVLPSDIPWENSDVWSICAAYFFVLHVPLSFGGLSVIAQILHEPNLDPLTMVVSITVLQVTEYVGVSTLLHFNAKPQYDVCRFFHAKWFLGGRNCITASIVGIGTLIGLVFLTSIVADMLVGPKDVNDPILQKILLDSPLSMTSCFFLYCLVTPLLEETVYRGFLLSSLSSTMKWWQAVIISSFVFSIGHFSGENSLQLFLIGCVVGSAYCWTGQLTPCFAIHSVYNAMILLITMMS
ncbi:CAAX protease self-immunity [Musa troglodytarum]|uniref:CAAX protease self-immunity n=1 Tax=Musa troglodytarum TaxID=320322 RepID=A0A9E7K835_9LILI|nr:CAAX protease self-immunity [Musa troglodytarum]